MDRKENYDQQIKVANMRKKIPQRPTRATKAEERTEFVTLKSGKIEIMVRAGIGACYLEGYHPKKGWQRISKIGPRGCRVCLPSGKYEKLRLA